MTYLYIHATRLNFFKSLNLCDFSGGAKEVVHAAADIQNQDDAQRQPAHIKATRRAQNNAQALLAAGVPQA